MLARPQRFIYERLQSGWHVQHGRLSLSPISCLPFCSLKVIKGVLHRPSLVPGRCGLLQQLDEIRLVYFASRLEAVLGRDRFELSHRHSIELLSLDLSDSATRGMQAQSHVQHVLAAAY